MDSRAIGPIGTVARVLVGLLLVVVAVANWRIGWWDLAAGLVAFPLIATGAGVLVGSRAPWLVLVLVFGVATLATFVTPADGEAVWLFVGASMLLAAARGDGGCEVLAFPNSITGRRDTAGCLLYGPIDSAEARRGGARALS